MPTLEMHITHLLPQDQALRRVQMLLVEVQKEHAKKISDLREKWQDNVGEFSFNAMGFSVSGTLTVKSKTIDLAGNLPFAAAFFKGKIESVIRERVEILLA